MIFLKTLPTRIRNFDLWPQQPPKFRKTLETYSEYMRGLAVSLVRFLCMAMGLTFETADAYKEGHYEVRMNLYPACPQPDRVMGMSPHADIYGITLLLECGNVPGLQVLKDGQWVFVVPIDGAIVVNLGHLLEIMSNGKYKAAEHRAVVSRWKERHSIVTFCYPHSSFVVEPAKQLITNSGRPPLYKMLSLAEYLHTFFNRRPDLPFIDLLRINLDQRTSKEKC